jgi:hypothetical protein
MGCCCCRSSSPNVAGQNAVPRDIKKAKSPGIAIVRPSAAGSRFVLLHRTMKIATIPRRLGLAMPGDRLELQRQEQAGGSP